MILPNEFGICKKMDFFYGPKVNLEEVCRPGVSHAAVVIDLDSIRCHERNYDLKYFSK